MSLLDELKAEQAEILKDINGEKEEPKVEPEEIPVFTNGDGNEVRPPPPPAPPSLKEPENPAVKTFKLNEQILGPFVEWHEFKDSGMVTMYVTDKDGRTEKFGYRLTSEYLMAKRNEFRQEFIKDMGETIAARLFDSVPRFRQHDYDYMQSEVKKKYLS